MWRPELFRFKSVLSHLGAYLNARVSMRVSVYLRIVAPERKTVKAFSSKTYRDFIVSHLGLAPRTVCNIIIRIPVGYFLRGKSRDQGGSVLGKGSEGKKFNELWTRSFLLGASFLFLRATMNDSLEPLISLCAHGSYERQQWLLYSILYCEL